MSHPELEVDLAAALQFLEELGPLQVLDVHPTPPRHRPATPPAPAAGPAPKQPGLFDPEPEPATSTSTTDPYGYLPPSRRRREVLHVAGTSRPTALPLTPDTL